MSVPPSSLPSTIAQEAIGATKTDCKKPSRRSSMIEIVAETLAPGVNISEIARRHEINPQQLFGWRKRFRGEAEGLLASGDKCPGHPSFAPVLIEAPAQPQTCPTPPAKADDTGESAIEVTVGGATLRIRGAADAKTLALVLKALKVLA